MIGLVVLVALMLFGGAGGYKLTAVFENGGQLVKGNQVHVGGRPVGTVDSIELNDQSQAVVEMTVTDEELTPLHRGTKATIRATSLSGIANRYVELSPGPNSAPEIEEGGQIAVGRRVGARGPRPAVQHPRSRHPRRPAEVHHRARPTSTGARRRRPRSRSSTSAPRSTRPRA